MADTYQLKQFATTFGYELQTAMGVDPALGRNHVPGAAFLMDWKEAYNKEPKFPMGTRVPGPHFQVPGNREYSQEVQMTLSEDFTVIALNEFISLSLGVLERVISHDNTPGGVLVGEIITGGVSGGTGIVIAVDGSTVTYEPTSIFTELQSGETLTSISGSFDSTSVPTATGKVIQQRPLRPYITEFGWDPNPLGSGAPRWYHSGQDSKTKSLQWTLRPGKEVMLKADIWSRLHNPLEAEIQCVGNNLSDLLVPNTAAIFEDVTIDFFTIPGGTPLAAVVKEMDLIVDNNFTREPGDNQSKDAVFISEGDLDVTVSFKVLKEDNDLLAILRASPFEDAGKVRIVVTIDQTSGHFMEFDMPEVVLRDMTHTLSEAEKRVMESYGGVMNGVPIIDLVN